jgi:hypothetical protein
MDGTVRGNQADEGDVVQARREDVLVELYVVGRRGVDW